MGSSLALSSFPRRKNTGGSGQTAFFAPLRCAKQRVSPFAVGSIRSVRAEDKSSLASFEYKPYGALHASSGSLDLNIQAALGAFEDESHLALAAEGSPMGQPSAGHRWESDVQQYFAPYRYYSPTTARWLTRDPAGMIDGPNVYGYVGQNSINRSDPFGLGSRDCSRQECIDDLNDALATKRATLAEAMLVEIAAGTLLCFGGCSISCGLSAVMGPHAYVACVAACTAKCTAAVWAAAAAQYTLGSMLLDLWYKDEKDACDDCCRP